MSKKITTAIVLVPTLWITYAVLLLLFTNLAPATVGAGRMVMTVLMIMVIMMIRPDTMGPYSQCRSPRPSCSSPPSGSPTPSCYSSSPTSRPATVRMMMMVMVMMIMMLMMLPTNTVRRPDPVGPCNQSSLSPRPSCSSPHSGSPTPSYYYSSPTWRRHARCREDGDDGVDDHGDHDDTPGHDGPIQ
jgi:hypothetical protein